MCIILEIKEGTLTAGHKPVYPISIAAELLSVHERTLYLYEKEGLLIPARRGTRRFYSEEDLSWIRVIRYLIHEKGVSVAGLRRMLGLIPCWEVRGCSTEDKASCAKPGKRSEPCWLISARPDRKCYLCPVYQLARQHVCDDGELRMAGGS